MPFAEKLDSARSELVYLVKGKNNGRDLWHYILVDKSKLPMFKVKSKSPFIQLEEYGKILYSGWGVEPPDDIKQKIKEQFR